VVLENLPVLADVTTISQLLEQLGAEFAVERDGATRVRVARVKSHEAPYELVSTMRASVLVLGPLLARTGVARVALPGGCAIGLRPVDLHLKGLQRLGADIGIENGYVEARASRLKGCRITLDLVTVTGTENLMMAAALAEGTPSSRTPPASPRSWTWRGSSRPWGPPSRGPGPSGVRSAGSPSSGGAATGASRIASRPERCSWLAPSPGAT
jgi:UDP-N-acetylglucosamine 1-carboxyvinyltransferase